MHTWNRKRQGVMLINMKIHLGAKGQQMDLECVGLGQF